MTPSGGFERRHILRPTRPILEFSWNAGTELRNPLILLNKTCSSFCSKHDLFQLRLRFYLEQTLRALADTLSQPCLSSPSDELLYNEICPVCVARCVVSAKKFLGNDTHDFVRATTDNWSLKNKDKKRGRAEALPHQNNLRLFL